MKNIRYALCLALLLTCATAVGQWNPALHENSKQDSAAAPARERLQIVQDYGRMPLAFEPNLGQTDAQVQFLSRGEGYALFLTPEQAVFSLRRPAAPSAPAPGTNVAAGFSPASPSAASLPATLRMSLLGADARAAVSSEENLSGHVNYLLGNDPAKWRTNVPLFGKVRYTQVYPGIDLVYYGNQRQLEFDFVVAAGGDPRQIRLHIAGASDRKLDTEGNLVLTLDGGEVRFHKPLIYQRVGSEKKDIPGAFRLEASGEVSFDVGAYDASQPLVIDPVLLYSSFLGGNGDEGALDIALDSSNNAYVTGFTTSTNFPVQPSGLRCGGRFLPPCAFQVSSGGGRDAFVTKVNADGTLGWSTYFGGSGDDEGRGIAVDSNSNVYITGQTASTNLPIAPSPCGGTNPPCPYQSTNAGSRDAFVAKLNSSGSALVYSTYVGGNPSEYAEDIVVDSSGNAFITGVSDNTYDSYTYPSPVFYPTTSGAYQTTRPDGCYSNNFLVVCPGDAFVTKLNATGSGLVYSTFLGGSSGRDWASTIALGSGGGVFVGGSSTSTNFPVTAGAFQTSMAGSTDGFVTRLNSAGSALLYSTYLGGSGTDEVLGLGVRCYLVGFTVHCDASVTGDTNSCLFPLANAYQSVPAACGTQFAFQAFVSTLNSAGSGLVFSTYLGGASQACSYCSPLSSDMATALAVDAFGVITVVGLTRTANFPTVNSMQPYGQGSDAFVARFTPSGNLFYSTFLGGSQSEEAHGIALDSSGNAYVTGFTKSLDFPTANPLQANYAGDAGTTASAGDAFVAKLSPELTPSANAGSNQVLLETVPGATPFTLSGSGSDPDNDPLTYEWRDSNNVIVGSAAVINLTRGVGVHVFTLYVRDNGGGVGTDTVTITIHRPPVANAGPDQIVEASSNATGVFTLDGSASSDPDGNAITYQWRDSANNIVGTTALVVVTRPLGSHTFTLIVTDSHGIASPPDSVNILVQDTTAPTVVVTRPNGGDKLFTGTPYLIEWTATDNGILSFFDVFVSLDGGVSYNPAPVCANVSGASRSCTWAAPGPVNSMARIRVRATDGAGLTAQDASNANFSIVTGTGSVTVTAPNTAVDWGIGSTQKITWNHNLGLNSYMQIEVSRDSGATWSVIQSSFKNTGASSSTFNWLVTGPITDGALIRVSWANGPAITDNSNVEFTISDPYIVVAAPATTAANWGYGTTRAQTWTTNLGPLDKVNVLMSTDGGATFPVTLASNIVASNKTVTFTTPTLASPAANARIRVVWVANSAILGTTPTNFQVQPAFVRVTNPNFSNHLWTIGTSQTLTWTNNLGTSENVKIELSLDGGQTFPVLVLGTTPSDGTQAVVVQAAWATQTARVRITWLKNSLMTDMSNQDFRIQ